ncbi:methyl-accepting chemotaxis protein [Heyndrickxia acidicola]|uniref:Methyl-accepting chemotaxis protein n=1 Tax=Heyndrickxia acidicola TaxID=209389 RepID=A0ABU6MJ59_9BACI|nr:methyl-accepting chemotaxis protein [Heyndrickxia acidicola]MED1203267.1 methyl-accepting chemotaxis protein [Heyndrickxia acidicola]
MKSKKTKPKKKTNTRKTTIKWKILRGFIAVLVLLVLVGGSSIFNLLQTQKSYQSLLDQQVQKLLLVKDLKSAMQDQNIDMREYLVTGNVGVKDRYYVDQKTYLLLLNQLEKSQNSASSTALLQQIETLDQSFMDAANQEFQLKEGSNNQQQIAEVMDTTLKQISSNFKNTTQKLVDNEQKTMNQGVKNTQQAVNINILVIEILSVAALAIGLTVSIIIGRMISTPIQKVTGFMEKVAKGNLNVEPLQVKSKDEIGQLAASFNQMVEDLRVVVSQVIDSSMQVASSSEQLTASAQQSASSSEQVSHIVLESAQRTEDQLQTFTAISASVNEMATNTSRIASYSKGMLEDSQSTSALTQKGSESVAHVVSQMNEIHQSVISASDKIYSLGQRSNEIRNMTALITGIAEQTNLLALNAAIESARAGEHGKGFAVVANEVRKLAEESRNSADQIKQMVTLIQQETNETVSAMEQGKERVERGLSYTNDVNHAFKEISVSIDNVTKKVTDVSTAVEKMQTTTSTIAAEMEQAKGISQELASGSHENASATQEQLASMEEISASAEALSSLAENLQSAVTKFHLS